MLSGGTGALGWVVTRQVTRNDNPASGKSLGKQSHALGSHPVQCVEVNRAPRGQLLRGW